MKKNRLLMVALAALTVGAMVSCGNTDTPDTPDEPDQPTTDVVPTEEGKVTFYFQPNSASVELPDYASYFLTGGWIDFATGTNALEMKKNDNGYFYVIAEAPDTTKGQGNEYQIVQGYNASSKMAAAKLGLQWNDAYKSDEELALEALKNPTFTYASGDKTIDLGTHKFSKKVTAPAAALKNYTYYVSTEAIPEYDNVFIPGSWNNWGNSEDVSVMMTAANAERTLWKYTFTEIYADTYEYAVVLSNTTKQDWSYKCKESAAGNMKAVIYQTDGDNFDGKEGAVAVTFDMLPGNPLYTFKYKFIFVNSGTGALTEGVEPALCGGFTGWKYKALSKDEGGASYSADFDIVIGEELKTTVEFGVVNMKDTTGNWVGKIAADGGNLKAEIVKETKSITISGDWALLGVTDSFGTVVVA